MNKVILIGRLGQDPETRFSAGGSAITRLSLATTYKWTDKKSGEKKEKTSWHRCVAFGRSAETLGEYAAKGSLISIEGRLEYGSYEGKDGVKKYTTDILIDGFEFLSPKSDRPSEPKNETPKNPEPVADEFDDDIPF